MEEIEYLISGPKSYRGFQETGPRCWWYMPLTMQATKFWSSIIPVSGVIGFTLPFILRTFLPIVSCFLWLAFFLPNANIYPLGNLLTNRNFPHSQKASKNDFHGRLWQALPLPSRVFLMNTPLSFLHLLLPSTCYAG